MCPIIPESLERRRQCLRHYKKYTVTHWSVCTRTRTLVVGNREFYPRGEILEYIAVFLLFLTLLTIVTHILVSELFVLVFLLEFEKFCINFRNTILGHVL